MKILVSKLYASILTFILVCLCSYASAQSSLVMTESNSTKDINFTTCASIRKLNFGSSYGEAFIGHYTYTWKLYRDDTEINSFEQDINCEVCDTCPPCDKLKTGSSFFNTSPISGAYKISIKITHTCFLVFTCTDEDTQYSNVINVTRLDDGLSCTCDTPENLTVNCEDLTFIHNGSLQSSSLNFPPQPYTTRVRNNLTANCAIVGNGQPVTFFAGKTITLTSGFSNGGDNFQAIIDPCSGLRSSSNSNETVNAINNSQIKKVDSVSISNIDKKIVVFPNPTSTNITINPNGLEVSYVNITNILGQLIYEDKEFGSASQTIDLSENKKGVYIIRITSNQGVTTYKIVLQ